MPQGQFPTILAGTDFTAGLIQSLAPLWARKDADTPRSNTVTLTADSDLLIPMAANGIYLVVGYLIVTGAAIGAGDLQADFTVPAGGTVRYTALGYATSGATTVAISAARSSGSAILGVNGSAASPGYVMAQCTNGATPGNLQMRWAQNTSNATATTLKAGSWLAAIRTA